MPFFFHLRRRFDPRAPHTYRFECHNRRFARVYFGNDMRVWRCLEPAFLCEIRETLSCPRGYVHACHSVGFSRIRLRPDPQTLVRLRCSPKFISAAVDCLRIKAKVDVNTCADYTDEYGYARRRNFLSPNPEVSRIGVSKTLIRVNPSHPRKSHGVTSVHVFIRGGSLLLSLISTIPAV